MDDSNAGKPYAESRFLAETVGNGLPELFTGVERGEMLHHTFYTEQLLRFKRGRGGRCGVGALRILWNGDGEFESMQRMLEDTGVMTTSSDGRQFVYLTGIHTIRNHVNCEHCRQPNIGAMPSHPAPGRWMRRLCMR